VTELFFFKQGRHDRFTAVGGIHHHLATYKTIVQLADNDHGESKEVAAEQLAAIQGKSGVEVALWMFEHMEAYMRSNHMRMVDLFRSLDQNHDDDVSEEELAKVLQAVGVRWSLVQLQSISAEVLRTLDVDTDGKLSVTEFEAAVRALRQHKDLGADIALRRRRTEREVAVFKEGDGHGSVLQMGGGAGGAAQQAAAQNLHGIMGRPGMGAHVCDFGTAPRGPVVTTPMSPAPGVGSYDLQVNFGADGVVAGGGRIDIRRHVVSAGHASSTNKGAEEKKLTPYCPPARKHFEKQTTSKQMWIRSSSTDTSERYAEERGATTWRTSLRRGQEAQAVGRRVGGDLPSGPTAATSVVVEAGPTGAMRTMRTASTVRINRKGTKTKAKMQAKATRPTGGDTRAVVKMAQAYLVVKMKDYYSNTSDNVANIGGNGHRAEEKGGTAGVHPADATVDQQSAGGGRTSSGSRPPCLADFSFALPAP
jgi:hypothetical protein